jgi:hypothetical protein
MGVMTGGTMDFVDSIEHKIAWEGQELGIGQGIIIGKRYGMIVRKRKRIIKI